MKTLRVAVGLMIAVLLLGFAAAVPTSGSPVVGHHRQPAEPASYTWHYERLGQASVGQYASLALDTRDRPHMSACSFSGGPSWTCNGLVYATISGSTWMTETVDSGPGIGAYSSLALDSQDRPHIAYQDSDNHELRYARWNGTSWEVTVALDEGTVGQYTSLALDSNDRPHISTFEDHGLSLLYVHWDGEQWQSEVVDDTGRTGTHTSLALNADDRPAISYVSEDSTLRIAAYDGSTWHLETIASGATSMVHTSVALDSGGWPYVTFSESGTGKLMLANRTTSGWRFSAIASRDAFYSSLTLDGRDVPHVSYNLLDPRLPGGGLVRYGYRSGGSWELEDVGPAGAPDDKGWTTALDIDSQRQPHVAYFDHQQETLTYAWRQRCDAPLTHVAIEGPLVIDVGTIVNLGAVITPEDATEPIAYDWAPEPDSGQGRPDVSYHVLRVGRHDFDVTASNCGGKVRDNHELLALPTRPYTWTVTTTADDMSLVSLRLALTYARRGDTITFDQEVFPEGTAIELTEPLPLVEQGDLTLSTGGGWTVAVDGSALSAGSGLVLASNANHVLGLELLNMPDAGIEIQGDHNRVGWATGSSCDGRKVAGPMEAMSTVVSGSGGDGILITGDFNTVSGAEISGSGEHGIVIEGASDNLIGGDQIGLGNVIRDSVGDGVHIAHETAARNHVHGNYVGSNDSGLLPHGNQAGVRVTGGPIETQIGGAESCQGNLIVDSSDWGIDINGAGTDTLIQGNMVGVNAAGEALANSPGGVQVQATAGVQIGGQRPGTGCGNPCNVISGNDGDGVALTTAATSGAEIYGNRIGLKPDSSQALGNRGAGISLQSGARANQIGGKEPGWGNLIGGNEGSGVLLSGAGVDDNVIAGNIIGLDGNMEARRGNQSGIVVGEGAQGTLVDENIISGNTDWGVYLFGDDTADHVLRGNVIGTTPAEQPGLGNLIGIQAHAGCSDLVVGGPDSSDANLIAHNEEQGVKLTGTAGAVVQSNTIMANGVGVLIGGDSTNDVLVAANSVTENAGNGVEIRLADGARIMSNTIRANGQAGVDIGAPGTDSTVIEANDISANEDGVTISSADAYTELRSNLVRDNVGHGVLIGSGFDNLLTGNEIYGNGESGVFLHEGAHDNELHENEIRDNGSHGVTVSGETTVENEITGNAIYGNGGQRIDNTLGGNTELAPPMVADLRLGFRNRYELVGQACAGCRVHVYVHEVDDSGSSFWDQTTADAQGWFTVTLLHLEPDQYPDVTATDADGNTSEYASDSRLPLDLELTDIEVVQSIQSPRNSVGLIAGKQTYVRLHVRSNWDFPVFTTAGLRIIKDGHIIGHMDPGPWPACPSTIGVKRYPDRSDLQDAFCFRLEDDMTAEGDLRIEGAVNPGFEWAESTYANNTGVETVTFETSAPLEAQILMITYPENLYRREELKEEYSACGKLTLGDYDADGLQEVIVGNDDTHELRVFGQKGNETELELDNTIVSDAVSGYDTGDGLVAGDLDGDGKDEILITYRASSTEGLLSVWSWDRPYKPDAWTLVVERLAYETGGGSPDLLAAGDVDGDGLDEVLIKPGSANELAILDLVGFGLPLPFAVTTVSLTDGAADIVVADLVGSPQEEIVVLDRSYRVHLYEYQAGTLQPVAGLGGGFAPTELGHVLIYARLAVGDIDGVDGPEIVIGSLNRNGVYVYRWTGSTWELATFHDTWWKEFPGVFDFCGSMGAGDIFEPADQDELVVGSPRGLEIGDLGMVHVLEKRVAGAWRSLDAKPMYEREFVSGLERVFPVAEVAYNAPRVTLDKLFGPLRNGKMYALMAEARAGFGSPHDHMTWMTIMEGDDEYKAGQSDGVRSAHFPVNTGEDGHVASLENPLHEIGHTRGRGHSYIPVCGPHDGSQRYPYPEGTIGASGREPEFRILDISDPSEPSLVGDMPRRGFGRDVWVEGDYAYFAHYYHHATLSGGLTVIDISQETTPTIHGRVALAGGPRRLEMYEDVVYVADVYGGLYAIDVSDPSRPTVTDQFELPPYKVTDHQVPEAPHAYDLHRQGDRLYLVDYPPDLWSGSRFGGHLRVFDIADPTELSLTTVITPTQRPNDVYVSGDYAYIATNWGMEIWDLTDPSGPVIDTVVPDKHWSIAVDDGFAYLGTDEALKVIAVSHPASATVQGGLTLDDRVYDIHVKDSIAYVATRLSGVKVVDVSDPSAPVVVGEYDPPGPPFVTSGLTVVGNRLYLATWDSDFYGMDTGDLALGISPSLKSPYEYRDLMTYCGPRWLSVYQYEAIRDELNDSYPAVRNGPAAAAVEADTLLVAGIADPGGTGVLSLLMRNTAALAPTALPLTSTVHLVAVDASDVTLADYPLPTTHHADPENAETADDLIFEAVVPFPAGAAELRLLVSGSVAVTRTVSAHPPMVTLDTPNGGVLPAEAVIRWTASDADGDPLHFSIYHSADGGASWSLLTSRLQGTSYAVSTSDLPGSTETLFRVMASDGVNTAYDESDRYVSVAYQAPEVLIGSPVDGTPLTSGQTVLLAAEAWDPDLQPIRDTGFSWRSDRDGMLGTGQEIIVDSLSRGRHQITVRVVDANGDVGSASVVVYVDVVVDTRHTYLPLVMR